MFASFLKMALVVAIVFASFNMMLNWRRSSNYDTIFFQESKESIAAKLGQKIAEYPCNPEQRTLVDQIDAFCQQAEVAEVVQFQSCYISMLCPSKALIAFNQSGQMIYKVRQH